ncbi:MAG: hypothetical protein EA352_11905 [Gemmatimonadales bacterium]|nr:MAG: hypothetical protein EA352_11905 [Gemmatimonadales bacterium]
MQYAADQAMQAGFERIEGRPGYRHPLYSDVMAEADPTADAATTPYVQGMFIALDPFNGQVRAMIGGRDFEHSKFDRARQARRQAGSTFKTFVFAAALEGGLPASHIVADAPIVRTESDGSEWRPRNFDAEFHGDMTLREAYRRSINMVAIRLGDEEVGLETVAQTARRFGVNSPIPRVPSMPIGATDLLPMEMAEAYSTFAALGTKVRPFPILRVENAQGDTLWEPQPERVQVMDAQTARLMVSMMEDVVDGANGTGGRIRSESGLPREVPAAGKTGTTNNRTDVWFVGFTPTLQAAVWFGMDRPMQIYPNATGGADAAPVFGDFMRRVYVGDEEANGGGEPLLPIPQRWPMGDLASLEVDNRTGLLASRWCPADRRYTEYFIPGTEPTEECDDSSDGRRTPRWPW